MAPNNQSASDTTFATSARDVTGKKCDLYIDGTWYEAGSFVPYHPGGHLIMDYTGKDASDVFHAFHDKETVSGLASRLKPLSPQKPAPPSDKAATARAFRELRQRVADEGLLKTNKLWYLYKTASTFVLLGIAIALMKSGHPILGAVFLGVYWQQMGWLSHEYCHHQVFENRKINDAVGLLCGNLFQGFSVTWWKDRHNSHHASTNIVEADPDLDNLPLMVWSKKDIPRMRDLPLAQTIVPFQKFYFWFVLAFLRIIWMLQSYLFAKSLNNSTNHYWKKLYFWEYTLINLHYVFHLYLLSLNELKYWPAVFFISNLIAGFGIGVVVFFNHYAAHHFSKGNASDVDFFELQMRTTRNMTPGVVTDWICGGLNYQIEHHLFPTMPRHNLNYFSKIVKQVAKKAGLPYMCEDFVPGVKMAVDQLDKISKHVVEEYKKDSNKKKN